jgi:hypothetical protein
MKFLVYSLLILSQNFVLGKIYEKYCDIVDDLVPIVPFENIYLHLCVINNEFNSLKNLYGIQPPWWCNEDINNQNTGMCNIMCSKLKDNDITDDAKCTELILKRQTLEDAWRTNETFCRKKFLITTENCLEKHKTTRKEIATTKVTTLGTTTYTTTKRIFTTRSPTTELTFPETNSEEPEKRVKLSRIPSCLTQSLNVISLIIFMIFLFLSLLFCIKFNSIMNYF